MDCKEISEQPELNKEGELSTLRLVWKILVIMIPSFLSLIMDEIIWQFTIIYVGRLNDPVMLSAVGMVNNVNLLIPITFTFGTSRTLGTYVSQSFGAQQYQKCAEFLNK